MAGIANEYTLVVADPPHGDVDLDRAGGVLGLTPEQLRGKVAYSVPEIWVARPDAESADRSASALRDAGCRVVVTTATQLFEIPAQRRVRSFSFTDRGLVAHTDAGDELVDYGTPVVGVSCRPRETPDIGSGGTRASGSYRISIRGRYVETATGGGLPTAGAGVAAPFLDIYYRTNGELKRVSVIQNAVSFAGLSHVQPRAANNMAAFVDNCEDRFAQGQVDRRLEGMRLRVTGQRRARPAEHRRGFSYGSPGFLELLGSVSQGFENLPQPEFSARLAYLTRTAA